MARGSVPTSPGAVGSPGGPFRRALVAVDAADPRDDATARATWWAAGSGLDLVFCHVVLRPTSAAGNEQDGSPADPGEIQLLQRLRGRLVAALGPPGLEVPIRILHGDPVQRICEYAEFAHCDLIVLGPRRRASIVQSLRGSVSKGVVSATRRAVLLLGDVNG